MPGCRLTCSIGDTKRASFAILYIGANRGVRFGQCVARSRDQHVDQPDVGGRRCIDATPTQDQVERIPHAFPTVLVTEQARQSLRPAIARQ